MPSINVSVPFSISKDEALRRIRNIVGELQKDFADKMTNVREEWRNDTADFSFDVMGFSVSGNVRVEANRVLLDGNIPFAVLPFKSRIEDLIREKTSELLS